MRGSMVTKIVFIMYIMVMHYKILAIRENINYNNFTTNNIKNGFSGIK